MVLEKVLFLLINFPKPKQGGNLYFDLVEEFRDRGKEVYVATLDEEISTPFQLTLENDIHVLRVRSAKYFNVGFVRKGIALLLLEKNFKKAIARAWPSLSFDCIIYPTPPITFCGVVAYLKRRDQAKCYLILRDIFPQNAIDLGVLSNPLVTFYFRQLEKKLYKISNFIGCMSPGNISYVLKHNDVEKSKLSLLPNWKRIRESVSKSNEQAESRFKSLDLESNYICIFGGVHGIAQDLEVMINLAKKAEEFPDVRFVFIGDGNQKSKLIDYAKFVGVKNVLFIDKLMPEEYLELVKKSQIGLVCLNSRFTIPNIPSKTLDFFELGLPVLAAVDSSTDYPDMLKDSGGGLACLSSEPEKLFENFKKIYHNQEFAKSMGDSGRKFLESTSLASHAYDKIVKTLGC